MRMSEGELVRIAWHLGNRHLPVQLLDDRIRIRADHVIEEMVEGLGGHVEQIEAPFDPEAGAYAGGIAPHHDDDDGHPTPADEARTARDPAHCKGSGSFAAPPARLAVAGVSHRRLRLFARPGMGGRSRRHHRRRHAARLARRRAGARRRPHRCDPAAPRASRRARCDRACADRELAAAMAPGRERQAETLDQGTAFVRAAARLGLPDAAASPSPIRSPSARSPAGTASTKTHTAAAYLQAFAANLISAAVRLVPLGQTAGLRGAGRARAHHPAGRRRNTRGHAGRSRRLRASAPTSPPCGTKPSTRGCSAHDHLAPTVRLRVGVGGPVGTGKTALMDALCKHLRDRYDIAAITNDIYTKEDAEFLTRAGSLPPERILGIETGGCPHTAIREDASINLAGVAELHRRFPRLDLILIESGGDNLAATFSPELADLTIYVIDVSAGDKIPRKGGPGITRSDLLVINKIDLAPFVGASLEVMDRDARTMRGERPFVFANIRAGTGRRRDRRLHRDRRRPAFRRHCLARHASTRRLRT